MRICMDCMVLYKCIINISVLFIVRNRPTGEFRSMSLKMFGLLSPDKISPVICIVERQHRYLDTHLS